MDCSFIACQEVGDGARYEHRAELAFAAIQVNSDSLRRQFEVRCHALLLICRFKRHGSAEKSREPTEGFSAAPPEWPFLDLLGHHESCSPEHSKRVSRRTHW